MLCKFRGVVQGGDSELLIQIPLTGARDGAREETEGGGGLHYCTLPTASKMIVDSGGGSLENFCQPRPFISVKNVTTPLKHIKQANVKF